MQGGWTALLHAVSGNHVRVVHSLLDRGANTEATDKTVHTSGFLHNIFCEYPISVSVFLWMDMITLIPTFFSFSHQFIFENCYRIVAALLLGLLTSAFLLHLCDVHIGWLFREPKHH